MKCFIGDLPLFYKDRGAGRPLLMLHGFGPDHRLMLGCMEPLFRKRSGWRRIYLDLPGMGKTPGPDWLTNSDLMLDVVRGFVDQIIPRQRYGVVAESYGAYLAQGLAARDADRIEGMLLFCPLVHARPPRRAVPDHAVLEEEPGLLNRLKPEERTVFETMNVVLTEKTWSRVRRDVLPGLAEGDPDFRARLWEGGYAFAREADLEKTVFDKPVLILTGRQDSVVGYEDPWQLLPRYPRATFAVFDRAGHNPQIEQPGLFAALAAEWLDRVKRSGRQ
jgi:pimeloyl-ACP methyl ester carboxylesterase